MLIFLKKVNLCKKGHGNAFRLPQFLGNSVCDAPIRKTVF